MNTFIFITGFSIVSSNPRANRFSEVGPSSVSGVGFDNSSSLTSVLLLFAGFRLAGLADAGSLDGLGSGSFIGSNSSSVEGLFRFPLGFGFLEGFPFPSASEISTGPGSSEGLVFLIGLDFLTGEMIGLIF